MDKEYKLVFKILLFACLFWLIVDFITTNDNNSIPAIKNESKSKDIITKPIDIDEPTINENFEKQIDDNPLEKQNKILKQVTNRQFQNSKSDMFGETRMDFLFSENGKGRATWRWTVNNRLEEGSSELTWEVIDSKIIVKYQYHSNTAETSNEKIVLIIDNNNPNCLENINDSNEKYCEQ